MKRSKKEFFSVDGETRTGSVSDFERGTFHDVDGGATTTRKPRNPAVEETMTSYDGLIQCPADKKI
jgi:hypothetical protein